MIPILLLQLLVLWSGAIYGEECLPDDVEQIFGYAGEQYAHVTYKDMVKTIDELF